MEPDREKLREDRWTILKISEDLTALTDITDEDSSMVKRKSMKMIDKRG